MKIWDMVRGDRKESIEEKNRREHYNSRNPPRRRIKPPQEDKKKRFAKNRRKFYITLNNGSEWCIEDTSSGDAGEEKGGLRISLTPDYHRPNRNKRFHTRTDEEDRDIFVDISQGGYYTGNSVQLVTRLRNPKPAGLFAIKDDSKVDL